MKQINNFDLILIEQLCERKIGERDFINKSTFQANANQLKYLLDSTENKVMECGNNQYFDAIFWKLPKSISKKEEVDIFKQYLLKSWHHEHEEMAGAFQLFFNDDHDNISILLQAINQIPDYLNYEDLKYPYIRKLIYAIGAQPEPYNIEALTRLVQSEDVQIRDLAFHQIEKRKRLGRWEAAKNTK